MGEEGLGSGEAAGVTAGRRSLAETAYDRIEQMIVSRQLAPGAMVSEIEIATELSLGRTPIREAIARLKAIGFVEVHPRRGVLVTPVDIIRHLELLEVRRPLDETVARCAIRRAGDADLKELRVLAEDLVATANERKRDAYFQAKRRLHEAETQAAHNGTLAATMAALHAQSRRFWYSYEPSDRFAESARYHVEIVEGIVTRDESRAVGAVSRLFAFLDTLTRHALDRRPLI